MIISIIIIIILTISILLATIKRQEKYFLRSGILLNFTIFNMLAKDYAMLKPIEVIYRPDIAYSFAIDINIQFFLLFFSSVVSFFLCYIAWLAINKEKINITPFLIRQYKVIVLIYTLYIVVSLIFKEIQIMWFSFLYVVYFLAAGFRSRKKDISYKKEANMIKDITTSVVLFTLVSVIFAYGHTAFFKNESKTCEVVTLKEYNKYLNYENFVNSSKDDYERGRHENLRTSLIWYNEKCKKYSEEDKEIINCNFLKFSKKQVEYNKKQGW